MAHSTWTRTGSRVRRILLLVIFGTLIALLVGGVQAAADDGDLPAPPDEITEGPPPPPDGVVGMSSYGSLIKCTKIANGQPIAVHIAVYQYFDDPNPLGNGCWRYNRSVQNAGQRDYSWKICYSPGKPSIFDGWGANRVYDDTSPGVSLSSESYYLQSCGSTYYGEYMARRSGAWCTNVGLPSPCWRRNPGPYTGFLSANVTVGRYFAEVFSGDSDVDSYLGAWQNGGYGASRGNSYAQYNIRPKIYRQSGLTTYPLYREVWDECNRTASGGLFSSYSASSQNQWALTTIQTDVNSFMNGMDRCSTGRSGDAELDPLP
jgi:hypothetical protein